MKEIYLETSCLLAWLFGEPQADDVIKKLNHADIILTSRLTILECERALLRAEFEKKIKETDQKKLSGKLQAEMASWTIMEMTPDICKRAGGKFPVEPIRSLDAVHLATALEFLQIYPDLKVLSFDHRVVQNLQPLGF
jgi:predicted nucleic acid-binding protein